MFGAYFNTLYLFIDRSVGLGIFSRMEQKASNITVDEIISLTEAAELLGLNSFRQVKTMIKNGHLKAYNKKWSKVKHVLKTDVIALREVEEA